MIALAVSAVVAWPYVRRYTGSAPPPSSMPTSSWNLHLPGITRAFWELRTMPATIAMIIEFVRRKRRNRTPKIT